eukprot:scaffold2004_cov107-Isochrysis_galbana.AAC.9
MYSSMVVIASVIGTHSEKRALARMPPKADETSARITRTQCIQYLRVWGRGPEGVGRGGRWRL